jgi:peptidoglycan hydrolase FlgJ
MTDRIASANNFLDINGLNDIRLQSKADGKEDKQQALASAAKQFESIFMQMVLKSMRAAEDVLASDSPFNTETTKFYRDMHDQQLAVELSNNGTLGLAPLIIRQLGGDQENFTPSSVFKHGNLSSSLTSAPEPITPLTMPAIRVNKATAVHNLAVPPFTADIKQQARTNEAQTPQFKQPKDFVTALIEPAKKVEQSLGVPFDVVIAQAALETGWGQKIIKTGAGNSSNNLFNIKADQRWQGEFTQKDTLEFEQGAMVKKSAPFRVYQSLMDSVNDYIDFLSSSERYQKALQHNGDAAQFLQGLSKAGYATDPDYVSKILTALGTVTSLLNN